MGECVSSTRKASPAPSPPTAATARASAASANRPAATRVKAVAPAAPAGYIGDPLVLHTVVGSPTGNNLFRLEELQGGGNGSNLIDQTTLFSVAGKRIDFTPPTATVTSPLAGATVRGTVPVTATATDNVGVTSLQIQVDDINQGLASASSPLTVSWNTTLATAGSHRLTAIARDLAGNVGTSAVVLVTVNNAAPPPPPPPPPAPGPLVKTPDVVGRPLADAQSRIAAVGLTSTFTSANNANVKVGLVISQSPVKDTLVPSGSNVALVVSLGP